MNDFDVVLPTCNPEWGFSGTIRRHADAQTAWRQAMNAIATATSCSPDEVRDFLDSRHGRHFADEVTNFLVDGTGVSDAIAAATTKWMGWTVGRATARDYGIPRGLPYLTGFILHASIEAEVAG